MAKHKPDQTPPREVPQGDPPAGAKTAADRQPGEPAAAPDHEQAEQPGLVETLRGELEEAKDRALRCQAELENYRKRVARQTEEERRYANLPLLRDLLPVLDNMDRAIEAAEKGHDAARLLEGFRMVARQFEDVLRRHHCERIAALNEPFDPHLHQAIAQQPSDEHPAGTVLMDTQPGFRLHDRVVRPSQVIVSAGDAPDRQPADATEPES